MGLLTVVRHGQASFLADNYDRLSPTGELQAQRLGEYWVQMGAKFDRVYYGPRERQIRTGEIAGAVLRQAGLEWPEPTEVADFDEYPAEEVMRAFLPELEERDPQLRTWMEQFRALKDVEGKRRALEKSLRAVTECWLRGEVASDECGTWKEFCGRVGRGIDRILAESTGKGRRVALFTSAGPMAATARKALQLSDQATLDLTWSPRNASFSEFLFTTDRFSLSTFHNTPHLESNLLTYR